MHAVVDQTVMADLTGISGTGTFRAPHGEAAVAELEIHTA